MYLVNSNNTFYLNKLVFVLNQIGIPLVSKEDHFYYGEICFEFHSNAFSIKVNKIDYKYNLPIDIKKIAMVLINILQEFQVNLDVLQFNPIKETISYRNKTIKLRNTHNLIIVQALKYKNYGMNKIDLYKSIWPKDVDVHLNKLDTHLTNLKNLLQKEFSYQFKYNSVQGILKFSIN